MKAHGAQPQTVLVEQLRAMRPGALAAMLVGLASSMGNRFDFDRLGRALLDLSDEELLALFSPRRRA